MSSWRNPKWKLQDSGGYLGTMPPPPGLPEFDKQRVGARITAIRLAKGLAQNTLADMIGSGLTPQKLNNYERGRDMIPVATANRLCVVTGVNFDYLYRGLMGHLPPDLAEKIAKAETQPAKVARRA